MHTIMQWMDFCQQAITQLLITMQFVAGIFTECAEPASLALRANQQALYIIMLFCFQVYVMSGGQMFRPGVMALSDLAVQSAAIEKNETKASWVERMMASANLNKPPGTDMLEFYQMDGGAALAEPTG